MSYRDILRLDTALAEKTLQTMEEGAVIPPNLVDGGVVVSPDVPYLGCSPDGLIGEDGLLEIKCPYSARDHPISADTVKYLIIDDNGNLQLKPQHDYYYQVMGTLMCTKRKWCDFVVWSFKGFEVIHIERDESVIKAMMNQLENFFTKHFRSALLVKHLYRGSDKFCHCRR